jgi:hypothetical protein
MKEKLDDDYIVANASSQHTIVPEGYDVIVGLIEARSFSTPEARGAWSIRMSAQL